MTNTGLYNSDFLWFLMFLVVSPIVFYVLLEFYNKIIKQEQPTIPVEFEIVKVDVDIRDKKKAKKKKGEITPTFKTRPSIMDDGVEALKFLGYSKKDAILVVNRACMKKKYKSVEELVQDIAMRVNQK